MRSPKWLACIGPLGLVAALLGCNPSSTTNPNITPDAGASELAYINIVHALVHPPSDKTTRSIGHNWCCAFASPSTRGST